MIQWSAVFRRATSRSAGVARSWKRATGSAPYGMRFVATGLRFASCPRTNPSHRQATGRISGRFGNAVAADEGNDGRRAQGGVRVFEDGAGEGIRGTVAGNRTRSA